MWLDNTLWVQVLEAHDQFVMVEITAGGLRELVFYSNTCKSSSYYPGGII